MDSAQITICSSILTNIATSQYLHVTCGKTCRNGMVFVQTVPITPQHFAFYGGRTVKTLRGACIKQIFNQNRALYNIPQNVVNKFLNLIFVVPSIMLYSSEISPTRCNNCVFILRNGFTLHVSGDNRIHHQEYICCIWPQVSRLT